MIFTVSVVSETPFSKSTTEVTAQYSIQTGLGYFHSVSEVGLWQYGSNSYPLVLEI